MVLLISGSLLVAPAVLADDPLALETITGEVPGFMLAPADGGATLDHGMLAGRTVLLHFWATWCVPCKEELPALQKLAATFDAARVTVVLIAIDTNMTAAEIATFARALGVTLPIYLARNSTVADSFWGWGLPVSYLIDARGRFIGRARGPRAWSDPAIIEALTRLSGSGP